MTSILLTGSSRGIGAATRAALSARGVKVIGHATRSSDADTVAADFSDPLAAQELWAEALERSGGRIDAVVNNG